MFMIRCSKWVIVLSSFLLAGLLASCGIGATAISGFGDLNLTGAEWVLASVNDKPVTDGTQATLIFAEANSVLGSTGCNLYAGTYTIGKDRELSLKPNLTTSWECEEPTFAQERAMLLVLSSSSNYRIDGDELKITNPDGERRATFTKMEPLMLEGTDWLLDAINNSEGTFVNLIDGTQIVASFDNNGNLRGSGGCNEYNATYTLDFSSISIGPIISTRVICSEPEGVMDQESNFYRALEQASTYRNYGIALVMFDAEGQVLASYISAEIARGR